MIRKTNKIVIAIQLGLFGLSLKNFGFFFAALMFSMILGAMQIILALILVFTNQKRNRAMLYLAFVALYFIVMTLSTNAPNEQLNLVFSLGSPIALSIYISSIIHGKLN